MADAPRTVLISGCSSGIGLELAVQLAHDPRQRYQVVATMRDLGKKGTLEAAAGEALGQTLTVAQLDVCSDESVAQCLSCIQGEEVDVLVNNAGVGLVGPLEGLSLAAMQNVFDTNFFGAVRLVKAVLPGMKRRRQGHIVVVSSVMGLQGVVFNEVYAASKFAMEGFFESLAVQLLQFNIFISLVEPGPVVTEFEGKLLEQVSTAEFPGTDPDTLSYFRDLYLPASRELFHNVGQSPQDVAKVIVKVIGSARPPLRRQTNTRYTPLTALKAMDPSGSLYVRTSHRLLFRWPRLLKLGLRCLACSCFRTPVWPRCTEPHPTLLTPEQPSLFSSHPSGCTTLHSFIHSFVQQTLPDTFLCLGIAGTPESTQSPGTDPSVAKARSRESGPWNPGILG